MNRGSVRCRISGSKLQSARRTPRALKIFPSRKQRARWYLQRARGPLTLTELARRIPPSGKQRAHNEKEGARSPPTQNERVRWFKSTGTQNFYKILKFTSVHPEMLKRARRCFYRKFTEFQRGRSRYSVFLLKTGAHAGLNQRPPRFYHKFSQKNRVYAESEQRTPTILTEEQQAHCQNFKSNQVKNSNQKFTEKQRYPGDREQR